MLALALVLLADPPFTPNVLVSSPRNNTQAENDMAIGPGGMVYNGWNESAGNWYVGFSYSTDYGDSWSTRILTENDPATVGHFDPIIIVDQSGYVYVGKTRYSGGGKLSDVSWARSTDGGQTFGPYVQLSNNTGSNLADKPWITAVRDTFYMVWLAAYFDVIFQMSTDYGATWTPEDSLVNNGTSMPIWPYLSVDGNSNIHVTWWDYNNPSDVDTLYYRRSTDHGATWEPAVALDLLYQASYWELPVTFAGPGGKAGVVWCDSYDGDNDIYVDITTDGGATWSGRQYVNDNQADGDRQDMATACFDPLGNLHAAWNDQRSGQWEIYYAYSTDNGASWSPSLRVSDQSAPMSGWWGHYFAIDADDKYVYISWTDDRYGDSDIWFSRAPNAVGVAERVVSPRMTIEGPTLFRGSAAFTVTGELEDVSVRLYAPDGRLVSELFSGPVDNRQTVTLSADGHAGSYFLVVESGNDRVTKKLTRVE